MDIDMLSLLKKCNNLNHSKSFKIIEVALEKIWNFFKATELQTKALKSSN